ncbi:Pentatricopeptide repeat-containing protein At3g50420 [Linum perenne]
MPTLSTLIQNCTIVTSLKKASRLHALILTTTTSTSYALSPYVNNNIVSMYARCGSLLEAQQVFDRMPVRTTVSYNALIAAYSNDPGLRIWCFQLFKAMGSDGLMPSGSTFVSLLKACCGLEYLCMGSMIHGQIVKLGGVDNVSLQTSLLGMYSNCRDLKSAYRIFDVVVVKDAVMWTAMTFGLFKNEEILAGLSLFNAMLRSDVTPTQFTYSTVLNACAKLGEYSVGRMIHSQVIVSGVPDDSKLQNALIDMYSSCGDTEAAFDVFSRIEKSQLVSWNSMISGYAENRESKEAMELFIQLLGPSLPKPDGYTLAAIISGTGGLPADYYGKALHTMVVKIGLEKDVFVGTTLLSMYFKNSDTASAEKVFYFIEEKDVVLWTEMLMGHSRLGDGESAMKLFCEMCKDGLRRDSFAFSGGLSACADLATLKQGEMIHAQAVKTGCDAELNVCGSLVHMYAKNGDFQACRSVFSQVYLPDLKCWNSMLGGYGQHGMPGEALKLFEEMLKHGVRPDSVTFLTLLSACSHGGFLEEGMFLWNYMKENGIIPGPNHYSCITSLLSRAGLIEKAEELISELPHSLEHLEVWRTLLSACVNKRNLSLGIRAANQILRLAPEDSATHILLSNLYAVTGTWNGVADMRKKMRGMMLEKDPGLSWIEIKHGIHSFTSGHQSNLVIDEAQAEVCKLQANMAKSKTDDLDVRDHAA